MRKLKLKEDATFTQGHTSERGRSKTPVPGESGGCVCTSVSKRGTITPLKNTWKNKARRSLDLHRKRGEHKLSFSFSQNGSLCEPARPSHLSPHAKWKRFWKTRGAVIKHRLCWQRSCAQRALSLSPPRRQQPGCSRAQASLQLRSSQGGAHRRTHSGKTEGGARRPRDQLCRSKHSSYCEQSGTHTPAVISLLLLRIQPQP